MRRFLWIMSCCVLFAGGLSVLATPPAGLPAFAPAEPELHLSADGSSLLFVHRAEATGEPDVAAAELLLAEARNPGLLRAFARHVFTEWLEEGLVGLDPEGNLAFEPEDKLLLEARLRLAVALELAPYLREVAAAADPLLLDALATGPAEVDAGISESLPAFRAPWYRPTPNLDKPNFLNKKTECKTCPKPDGSVWCPGRCVKGCGGSGANCWEEDVHGLLVGIR